MLKIRKGIGDILGEFRDEVAAKRAINYFVTHMINQSEEDYYKLLEKRRRDARITDRKNIVTFLKEVRDPQINRQIDAELNQIHKGYHNKDKQAKIQFLKSYRVGYQAAQKKIIKVDKWENLIANLEKSLTILNNIKPLKNNKDFESVDEIIDNAAMLGASLGYFLASIRYLFLENLNELFSFNSGVVKFHIRQIQMISYKIALKIQDLNKNVKFKFRMVQMDRFFKIARKKTRNIMMLRHRRTVLDCLEYINHSFSFL